MSSQDPFDLGPPPEHNDRVLQLIEAYVEARLKTIEERTARLLSAAVEKVKDEAWETRTWILLLTAASWGALAEDQDPRKIVGASVTLFLVTIAVGVFLYRWRRRKRRTSQSENEENE